MLPTILTIVLGIAFLAAGVPKLLGAAGPTEQVTAFGYSAGFARLVGLGETAAAAALGWGLADERGIILGCSLIIAIMIGALYSHLVKGKDPVAKWAPAAAMLILAAVLLGMTL
ncbi:MAG: DoxX family protein [Gemmatimonadota bacterium]|nr:DoxX family protein [Gemmatimonadota bacterium]